MRPDSDLLPTGELVRELVEQGQRLIREEVHLAKVEIRDEAKRVATAGGLVGSGGVLAHTGFVVLSFMLVFALATAMALWAAALIVGIVWCGAGILLMKLGRDRVKQGVRPEQTIETIKEDRRWAKETMRDVKSNMRANA
jgi:hypothetical protein